MVETYSVSLHFTEAQDLFGFMKEFHTWMKKKNKKTDTHGKTDNRGQRTHLLHAHAKEIKNEQPNITYRDCLRLAGKKIKNLTNVENGYQPDTEIC